MIGYGLLLSLSALEWLDMSKVEYHTDKVWDMRSVQYLLRFLTEWQAPCPGVKPPTLITDTDNNDD